MLPKQSEIEIPLLNTLEEMGGRGVPRDIYPRIQKFFPQLNDADLAETLASGGNKWTNRIQWVRQRLTSRGEMESPGHGVWAITEKGRKRLAAIEKGRSAAPTPEDSGEFGVVTAINFEELVEEYSAAFREKVLQKLQDLTPEQFERFAGVLLSAYGFVEVKVTGRTSDGGVDGHGRLKVGLATMDVAFQCKRWQGMVGRPEKSWVQLESKIILVLASRPEDRGARATESTGLMRILAEACGSRTHHPTREGPDRRL